MRSVGMNCNSTDLFSDKHALEAQVDPTPTHNPAPWESESIREGKGEQVTSFSIAFARRHVIVLNKKTCLLLSKKTCLAHCILIPRSPCLLVIIKRKNERVQLKATILIAQQEGWNIPGGSSGRLLENTQNGPKLAQTGPEWVQMGPHWAQMDPGPIGSDIFTKMLPLICVLPTHASLHTTLSCHPWCPQA